MTEIEKVVEQSVQVLEAYANNDKGGKAIAKILHNLMDALLAEGFSREEALRIVTNYGSGLKQQQ